MYLLRLHHTLSVLGSLHSGAFASTYPAQHRGRCRGLLQRMLPSEAIRYAFWLEGLISPDDLNNKHANRDLKFVAVANIFISVLPPIQVIETNHKTKQGGDAECHISSFSLKNLSL